MPINFSGLDISRPKLLASYFCSSNNKTLGDLPPFYHRLFLMLYRGLRRTRSIPRIRAHHLTCHEAMLWGSGKHERCMCVYSLRLPLFVVIAQVPLSSRKAGMVRNLCMCMLYRDEEEI